jgi:membrane fusion protein, adhesin transport system
MLNLSSKTVSNKIYRQKLRGLRVLRTPKAANILFRWLLGILSVMIIIMFLPWQQNIRSTGTVTAFSPKDRPQTVETAIAGRIENWFFQEGDFVQTGDTLVELSEIRSEFFDPLILERLADQLEALEGNIEAKVERIAANEEQIAAMRRAQRLQTNQQRNRIDQVRLQLASDSAELAAARLNYEIALIQFERQERLFQQGLISQRDLENSRLRLQETQARLAERENQFGATRNELINARIQLNTIQAEFADRISSALASLNQAQADLHSTRQSLSALETEYANMLIRRDQRFLRAPQSGTIVRARRTGIGETVAEGEGLLTIMPENPQLAVELFLRPMDVPLIRVGKKARVEFEGWPAIQFPGRPTLAVGTFGGIVRVIDKVETADRGGRFRVLITEDPNDDPWPATLRVGTGVWGWILLDEVPIWFEIWRQLNGFPPRIEDDPMVGLGEGRIRR